MKTNPLLLCAALMLTPFVGGQRSAAADAQENVVRVAKLQIDASQLESYKAALKEEIEASLRFEPGVLALNAVSEKSDPTHILIFEIYANDEGYRAHIESAHFKKYKTTTKDMVKSLDLVETAPILLGSKAK